MRALLLALSCLLAAASAFTAPRVVAGPHAPVAPAPAAAVRPASAAAPATTTRLAGKISRKRRDQLGIGEGEDEYDLGVALAQNTDDFISKVVAGSLIATLLALLVAGVVIPATADYGEGVCNPLLTGGRC